MLIFFALSGEIESSPKAPKFRVGDRVNITKYKNIAGKDYTKNLGRVILVIKSVLKDIPWTYIIKDLNEKKKIIIMRSFYEKYLLLSEL